VKILKISKNLKILFNLNSDERFCNFFIFKSTLKYNYRYAAEYQSEEPAVSPIPRQILATGESGFFILHLN